MFFPCGKRKIGLNSLCLILSFLFLINQSLYGSVSPLQSQPETLPPQETTASLADSLQNFAGMSEVFIPNKDKVNIDNVIRDPRQKLVFYIEDAHGNISAQKNIAESLNLLSTRAGLNKPWIALEGTEAGEIDHRVLSGFPYEPTRNRIADYFLHRGVLNGADYFAARWNQKAKLFGVDQGDLAESNRESYRSCLKMKPYIEEVLARLSNADEILKKRIYYGDIVEFNQIVENMEKNSHDYLRYLDKLRYMAQKNGISLDKYPRVLSTFKIKELDSKITQPELQRDWEAFKKQTGKAALKGEDILKLWTENQNVFHNFPYLERHAQMLAHSRSLEGAGLFQEIQALVDKIWKKILFYEEAQDAYFIDTTVKFYKKLFDFSLTPEEYLGYRQNPDHYSLDTLSAKIERYYFILRPKTLRPQKRDYALLKEAIQDPLNFYELAGKRNKPLVNNLVKLLELNPGKKTFFISGGFHREEITRELKRRGIPFILLTPRIENSEGHENYWRLLGGDESELEFASSNVRADLSAVQLRDVFKKRQAREAVAALLVADFLAFEKPSPELSESVFKNYSEKINGLDKKTFQSLLGRVQILDKGLAALIDPGTKTPQSYVRIRPRDSAPDQKPPVDLSRFDLFSSAGAGDYRISIYQRSEMRAGPRTVLTSPIGITISAGEDLQKVAVPKLSAFINELINEVSTKVFEVYRGDALLNQQMLKKAFSSMLDLEIKRLKAPSPDQARTQFAQMFIDAFRGRTLLIGFRDDQKMAIDMTSQGPQRLVMSFNINVLKDFYMNAVLKKAILAKKTTPAEVAKLPPDLPEIFFIMAFRDLMGRLKKEEKADRNEYNGRLVTSLLDLLDEAPLYKQSGIKSAARAFTNTLSKTVNNPILSKDEYLIILYQYLMTTISDAAESATMTRLESMTPKSEMGAADIQQWLALLRRFEAEMKAGRRKDLSQLPPLNGRYKFRLKLGEGGFGAAYLADDLNLKRPVAVKVTNAAIDIKAQGERLQREWFYLSALAAQGSHYFPPIIEKGGLTKDHPPGFMVMRFAKGLNGAELIKSQGGKVPLDRAVHIVTEVARGLKDLHYLKDEEGNDIGAVHRDIKPGNIIVEDGTVTVLDLGLVKNLKEAAEELETASKEDAAKPARQRDPEVTAKFGVTRAGELPGTPEYLPPERFLMAYSPKDRPIHTPVTPAADIFSLGITLYVMLTGVIPANPEKRGRIHHEVLINHAAGNYLDAVTYNPEIDPVLNYIISKSISPAYPEMTEDYWEGLLLLGGLKLKDPDGNPLDSDKPEDLEKIRKKEVLIRYASSDEFIADLTLWQEFREKGKTNLKSFLAAKEKRAKQAVRKAGLRPSAQRASAEHPSAKTIPSLRNWKKPILGVLLAGFTAILLFVLFAVLPTSPTDTTSGKAQTKTTEPTISYEGSMQFNGKGDAVVINSLLGKPKSVTLAAWVDLRSQGKNKRGGEIINIGDGVALRVGDVLASSSVKVAWNSTNKWNSASDWTEISWKENIVGTGFRFLAMVIDGQENSQKIYIDGKQIISTNHSSAIYYDPNSSSTIIGVHSSGVHSLDGQLAHVHVYGESLTQEEIKAIMNFPNSIKKKPLLYLPLNKIYGTRDLSANNNNGIIKGNPTYSDATPPQLLKLKAPDKAWKSRSEMRKRSGLSFENRFSKTDFYRLILSDRDKALLILPYEDFLVRSLLKKMLPLPNTHIVFLANKGVARKVLENYVPLEKMYGFRIMESAVDVSELTSSHPEFKKILMRVTASFGVPIQNLGRPVLFSEKFVASEANAQDLRHAAIIYLRFNKKRFVRELSYQGAHLISGIALSKKVYDILDGLAFQSQGNEIALTESAIRRFRADIKTILTIARYA